MSSNLRSANHAEQRNSEGGNGHTDRAKGREDSLPGRQVSTNGQRQVQAKNFVGLKNGWRRYGEIKSGLLTGSVGTTNIAPRVLSRELKTLVAMGMVERRDHQVFPLKVEYRLTRRGRTFLLIIAVIHKWGMRHLV